MKLFNKTAIALALSILGAASSVSALAMATDKIQLHEVTVEFDSDIDKSMNVFVNVDGDVTTLDVPASALNDPAELEKLLADVPENIREKLIKTLTTEIFQNGEFKVIVVGDSQEDLHWVSKIGGDGGHHFARHIEVISEGGESIDGDHKVIVMKFNSEGSEDTVIHKVIKKIMDPSIITDHHRDIPFIHKGRMNADRIIRMMKHSKFTADELDKIQQALDEKR